MTVEKPWRLIVFCMLSLLCKNDLQSQWSKDDLKIIDRFDDLEYLFEYDNDTTYLINFWATWCGPCVKEMPYFQEAVKHYDKEAFKLILVSLDFEKQIETRLIPFLNKHNIQGDMYVLLDGKTNAWIDRVDPRWSGAIPITIVYKGDQRSFHEKEFHNFEELNSIIKPIIHKK